MKHYIRIGEISDNPKSLLQVYDVTLIDCKWRLVLPEYINQNICDNLYASLSNIEYHNEPSYIVTGKLWGYDNNGCPLITDVKIEDKIKIFKNENNR